jgi:hypothetical protein
VATGSDKRETLPPACGCIEAALGFVGTALLLIAAGILSPNLAPVAIGKASLWLIANLCGASVGKVIGMARRRVD